MDKAKRKKEDVLQSPGTEDTEVSVHLICGQRHPKSNCRMDRVVEEAELGKTEKCLSENLGELREAKDRQLQVAEPASG